LSLNLLCHGLIIGPPLPWSHEAFASNRKVRDSRQPSRSPNYGGSASQWGSAIYLASSGKYEDSILPDGTLAGTPEQALDCACGLYLGDPTAWQQPPTN
jgi:hypothetical protein